MLKKIRIKNFKCLQDTGELTMKPLTILVGPNSSGKTSLIQMLLMLRQTMDSTDKKNPLAANNGWVQMGAYPGFIFKGEIDRNLEIELEYSGFMNIDDNFINTNAKMSMKLIFSYNRKTTQIELQEHDICIDDNFHQHTFRDRGKRYKQIITSKQIPEGLSFENVRPEKFYSAYLSFKASRISKDFFEKFPTEIIFNIRNFIENEFGNLFYLGPLRDYPKRFYVTSGQAPQDVGVRGERAVDVLWFSHLSEVKRIKKIEEEVRKWFIQFDIAKDIRLSRVSKGNYFQIVIIDPATGFETNLADIGFGASQTLPIIIESFYAPQNSTILIEQPEIHLHPKAQSILGDLFIKSVQEENRNFIIETHSEHILARIRRRVAEKKVDKDKIAIYYFEPTSEGTKISEVKINTEGQYVSFPEGFFEEDINESIEHLEAIRKLYSEEDKHA
jgi:predicted ATPase